MHGGMGFRDFASFNDELLAKQFWRLLKNPDDMWAKQLKGLYFYDGSALEARKGAGASWCWSVLIYGRTSGFLALKVVCYLMVNVHRDVM